MPTHDLVDTLRRLLCDGAVHTLGYLHANTRHLIPPESAARKYRRQSSNPNRYSLEQQVERGETQLIRVALMNVGAECLDRYRPGWDVRYQLDRAKLPWQTCPSCQLEFVAYRQNERYCSLTCLRKADAEKQRAYRLARRGVQTLAPRPRGRPPKNGRQVG